MTLPDLIQIVRAHRIDATGTIPPTLQHTSAGSKWDMWRCPCGRADGVPHETEICPDALEKALRSLEGGLTHDEIDQGVRNLGVDPTCGTCMGIFYTGMALETHTCPGPHPEVVVTLG